MKPTAETALRRENGTLATGSSRMPQRTRAGQVDERQDADVGREPAVVGALRPADQIAPRSLPRSVSQSASPETARPPAIWRKRFTGASYHDAVGRWSSGDAAQDLVPHHAGHGGAGLDACPEPTWGVRTAFSAARSRSGTRGSSRKTSSPAAKSRPSSRASASASSSTTGPREVFTRMAPGFIRAMRSRERRSRVASVSGQ